MIAKLKNHIRNIILHDRFAFIDQNRKEHLVFCNKLRHRFPALDLVSYGNYSLTKSSLKYLTEHSTILSGGVEFHIEFEDALIDAINCKIHFFEIDTRSHEWFENKYQSENYILNKVGLSDEISSYDLFGSKTMSFSSSMSKDLIEGSSYNFEQIGIVQTTTISDYMQQNNISSVDLLKLDIEGFALKVIKDTWSKKIFPNIIIFEAERPDSLNITDYIKEIEEITDLARKHGYKITFLPREDGYSAFATQFVFEII